MTDMMPEAHQLRYNIASKGVQMRVAFKYGIGGYVGKFDGMVFCYNRVLGMIYARRRVYPKITESHQKFGSAAANLF